MLHEIKAERQGERGEDLEIARDANRIASSANGLAIVAIIISVIAVVISIFF